MAAQVAEELKTITYATPPMEERRKKEKKSFKIPIYGPCFVGTGIVVGDVLGGGDWTLDADVLDRHFGQNCFCMINVTL